MYHSDRSAPGALLKQSATVLITAFCLVTSGEVRAQCDSAAGVQHRSGDGGSQDKLGGSVAVGDGIAVLGAPGHPDFTDTGAAYIVDSGSGSWAVVDKLMASDSAAGAKFGSAVATDGQWALIGAEGSASAYVFRNEGGTWTEYQKLTPPESAPSYGFAVGLSGNTAVIGAYGALSYSGKSYVYSFDGTSWGLSQTLSVAGAAAYDFFGSAVAVSGNAIAVGAYGEDTGGTNTGTVYLFRKIGSSWTQEQELKPGDLAAGDSFGRVLSLSGDSLVSGSPRHDSLGSDSGAAYIYWFDGSNWTLDAKLTGSDTAPGDQFGSSVAISGSVIVVGSPFWDDETGITNRGAVYPFAFDGTSWIEQSKLIATSPYGWFDDAFGNAVGVADGVAVAGSQLADGPGRDAGHVYTFDMTCATSTADCVSSIDCNDNDACTTDTCTTSGTCDHTHNSASCNDGNACTTNDTCSAGVCAGSSLNCDDGVSCTTDSCSQGTCVNDASACECVGNADCNDNNSCTFDTCSGGSCSHVNIGGSCNDGDACTTNDTCSGGTCAGALLDCNDNLACTVDSCSQGVCVNDAAACDCITNSDCNDGIACTTDTCSQGSCTNDSTSCECIGNAECNDGNTCTSDFCISGSCSHLNITGLCDDGDGCTTSDSCSGGSCAGIPLDCNDGVGCTVDSCSAGVCVNDAVSCDCAVKADCDDGNPCTFDSCSSGSCTHINITGSCNDGNACTANDVCSAGTCGGTPLDCNDGIACTVDSCLQGTCVNDDTSCECLANAECDDGIACTVDSCASGTCRNDATACECSIHKECFDGNSCSTDICGADRMCHHNMLTTCCGNGVCEKSEDSCTCGADCQDTSGAVCGNGTCEAGDGENCLTCPDDCNGVQTGLLSERFCCGAGAGSNPVACDDNRCYDRSVGCENESVVEPCCGNGICEIYESGCFCPEDCGAPLPYERAGLTCQDGMDNDCDGLVDCEDPDCKKESLCWTCNGNGVCEPGEDCNGCRSDCAGMARGRKMRRFCCGNGVLEGAERDPEVCDGNP